MQESSELELLAGNSLNPSDMKLMLVNGLPHLRVLDLSGLCNVGGQLNDKSCSIIASKLSKLHELQLLHQSKITFSGLQAIMRRCRDLKSLNTSVQFKTKELKKLVESFPKLVYLGIDIKEDHINTPELAEVIDTIGGRAVVYSFGDINGYLDFSKHISSESMRRYIATKDLVDARDHSTDSSTTLNTWHDLNDK